MSKQRTGSTPGVGGTRNHLSKGALRGGRPVERGGPAGDPQQRTRELLRRLREKK